MSIKVYILGEDIFCRIHLWSQIYSKSYVWRKEIMKNCFSSQNCSKTPKNVIHGSNLLKIGRHHFTSLEITLLFWRELSLFGKNIKRLQCGHFGQNLTSSPIGFWTLNIIHYLFKINVNLVTLKGYSIMLIPKVSFWAWCTNVLFHLLFTYLLVFTPIFAILYFLP